MLGEGEDARELLAQEMAVLGGGDLLGLRGGEGGARLILVAGRPLREPVARYGPFVMNTKQEIMQAFVDYQEGRF
jgi:redox-sensitive bicupin YhaK (pirin superfamily)